MAFVQGGCNTPMGDFEQYILYTVFILNPAFNAVKVKAQECDATWFNAYSKAGCIHFI